MLCPDQESLSAFADGELQPAQAAEIQEHVRTCAACRGFVDELRELDAWGRASLGVITVTTRSTSTVATLIVPRLRLIRPVVIAAAAVIVAGAFVALWLVPHTGQGPRTVSAPVPVAEQTLLEDHRMAALNDEAFARWAAPYLQLRIPLVSVEEAARYSPPPILPFLPDSTARYNTNQRHKL